MAKVNDDRITSALKILSEESQQLYLPPEIDELDQIPRNIDFLRDYVSKNLPVVIRGAASGMPCIQKWSDKYFQQTLSDKKVKVAVTPNGYADGIALHTNKQEYFVLPEEQTMRFSQFLDNLDTKSRFANYIQTQNNNLIDDFPELLPDIDQQLLSFAEEAFDKKPDAANFWMGDERAVTSMHKDPYENIYCVVSGFKDFILIPPTDYPKVPRKLYPSAIYKTVSNEEMVIEPQINDDGDPVMIQWVAVDPLKPDFKRFPQFRDVNMYRVRVQAGDLLYLPSLWYHHVRQSHKNISFNFWYDMSFDSKYCYYKMVEMLCDS